MILLLPYYPLLSTVNHIPNSLKSIPNPSPPLLRKNTSNSFSIFQELPYALKNTAKYLFFTLTLKVGDGCPFFNTGNSEFARFSLHKSILLTWRNDLHFEDLRCRHILLILVAQLKNGNTFSIDRAAHF
jgi:hypothetical protein